MLKYYDSSLIRPLGELNDDTPGNVRTALGSFQTMQEEGQPFCRLPGSSASVARGERFGPEACHSPMLAPGIFYPTDSLPGSPGRPRVLRAHFRLSGTCSHQGLAGATLATRAHRSHPATLPPPALSPVRPCTPNPRPRRQWVRAPHHGLPRSVCPGSCARVACAPRVGLITRTGGWGHHRPGPEATTSLRPNPRAAAEGGPAASLFLFRPSQCWRTENTSGGPSGEFSEINAK